MKCTSISIRVMLVSLCVRHQPTYFTPCSRPIPTATLDQRFPVGAILLPRNTGQCRGTCLVVTLCRGERATGILWAKARNVVKQPNMQGQAPSQGMIQPKGQ